MIGWLLDTHVVGALVSQDGAPSVKRWAGAQDETRMFLSMLTLGEIQQGIDRLPAGNPARSRYAGSLAAIEARFADRILAVTNEVVRRWGSISGRVRQETGHPPPVIDTLLAATAVENDLYLVTRNTKDVRLAGAALFNPWEDDPMGFALVE